MFGRNYTAHGGKETVIGGQVTFLPGSSIVGLEHAVGTLGSAGKDPRVALPNSGATSVAALKNDFNRLLYVLRAAGVVAVEPETLPEGETE